MSKLKELLGEELAAQVEAKLGDVKLDVVNDGSWIPKSKFDELNDSNKDLKQQIVDRDVQLKELGTKAGGNEDLQKQIAALQEANKQAAKDFESRIAQRDFDYSLESALKDAKVHNPKAVKALLETDKLSYKDGRLEGLGEQLEALKTTDSYLFQSDAPAPTPQYTPGNTTPPTAPNTDPFAAALAGKGY